MDAVGGESVGTLLAGSSRLRRASPGAAERLPHRQGEIPALIVTLGTLGMSLGGALLLTGGVDVREVPFKLVDVVGTGRLFGQLPYLVLVALVVGRRRRRRAGRHPLRPLHVRDRLQRGGRPAVGHLRLRPPDQGLRARRRTRRASRATCRSRASAPPRSAATRRTTCRRSPRWSSAGTSLFGGIGTILGTVIGVFIPAVLQNGFVIVGLQPFWQQVAVGAVLIIAVYLDQLRRRSNYQR
jgi:ribose transport system permease protein